MNAVIESLLVYMLSSIHAMLSRSIDSPVPSKVVPWLTRVGEL
ncbi:MAG TPA: hypothetical protein VGC39_07215 [Candidatus Methylacidiphilales bacterium]